MEHSPSRSVVFKDNQTKFQTSVASGPESNLTAKDGLFIATECHLALLPDEDGDTALHLAVVQNDIDACRKLLKLFHIAGKSIDVRNKLLQTPLHVAVITNQREIVKLLLNHKSSPDNPDRFGSTVYHLCAKYNYAECLIEILQNIFDKDGAQLNFRDYEGLTPLHVAVRHGSVATFKVLVANGADIDAKDNKGGRTPLIYAIEMNERKIVEMLLECDASVSQQTYSGDTALHIASGRGLQDIVRLLLRRGADVTMKNTHLETPISLATSPSVSDILRKPYGTTGSPELKALTTADSQYASHIARNMAVPMPPHFLKMMTHDKGVTMIDRQHIGPQPIKMKEMKRKIRVKTEHKGFESEDHLPAKRIAGNSLHSSNSPTTTVIIPFGQPYYLSPVKERVQAESTHIQRGVPVKQEYIEILPPEPNPHITHYDTNKADEEMIKKDIETAEEVEITLEEVEVSAEEVVQSKSDEEEKSIETSYSSASGIQEDSKISVTFSRAESPESTYTHKLMQYSTNNKNSLDSRNKTNAVYAKDNSDSTVEMKPVIVQKQPQLDVATALYRSNHNIAPNYHSFTPSASSLSAPNTQLKSKSVPNSPQPQPAEANLYQLAREGLAVAAMANPSNSSQPNNRECGITNYLKARPSRQAKIKSGTEELQNLALQGLAVAAMNAKSELLSGKKTNQNSDESDTTTNMTTVPKHLTQVLNPVVKRGQMPPSLHRSNSMPPKHYYEQESGSGADMFSSSPSPSGITSNHHLLALAHANARKEHVVKAVSAISMGQSHANQATKFHPSVTGIQALINDVSENTKQNLRQAIMVKNTPTIPQNPQPTRRVLNNMIKVPSTVNNTTNTKTSAVNNTTTMKALTPPAKQENPLAGIPLASPAQTVSSSTSQSKPTSFASKVVNITIPRKIGSQAQSQAAAATRNDNPPVAEKFAIPPKILANNRIAIPIPPQYIKTTKDTAPTNTVAPLQMLTNKVPLISKKTEQQTLVSSIGMTPIVASRVSDQSSSQASMKVTESPEKTPVQSTSAAISQPPVLPPVVLPSVSLHMPSTSLGVMAGTSGVPHLPVGLQPQSVINPLTNLGLVEAHTGSYLQPQIAYAPYGKDLIPVLISGGHAAALQTQYALQMQASQAATALKESGTTTISTAGVQINPSYLNGVVPTRLPTIDPGVLGRIPMSLQDAQMRGLYPMAAPVIGGHPHIDIFQQQYLRQIYQQQSLLLQNQNNVTAATTTPKPVAAVSAVPVSRLGNDAMRAESTSPTPDEQPLNLSKKPTDQPLNLKKKRSAETQGSSSIRSSVIKITSSVQSEQPKSTESNTIMTMPSTVPQIFHPSLQIQTPVTSIVSPLGDRQVYPSFILPPPIMLPGAVPQSVPSAGAAATLPPIHYVNCYGLPPQL